VLTELFALVGAGFCKTVVAVSTLVCTVVTGTGFGF
jgi:hypothetical protein